MTHHSDTTRMLSQITDAGLFERLAMAVLRQAAPELYGNLTHPGTNPDGKTVKAPIDGIAFVPAESESHMVTAHHTSGSGDDLRKKWLHNPQKTLTRAMKRSAIPAGDIIKTMRVVEEERRRTPGLRVTLALTTNREPPQDLTRDVEAAGKRFGINIDIWSCSRIAHYLDNDPDGQWLRGNFLGINQQRLSKQLLRDLSHASLKTLPLMARTDGLIDRELDRIVAEQSPRPVAFVVGESGLGKTIVCYKYLKAHIQAGGCGLVLTQEVLAAHRTIDQALDAELRKLHPGLESDAGIKARSLCSHDDPLLILVEDINRSEQPAIMLERLASWASNQSNDDSTENLNWHLLCPIWPKFLAAISEEASKRIDALSVSVSSFTADEARIAVQRNATLAEIAVTPLEADSLAEALGNDPLMIALYDFAHKPAPQQVIRDFINNRLRRLASIMGNSTLTDYRAALKALARNMLLHRRVDPTWTEVQEWLRDQLGYLTAIHQIVHGGELMRLIDTGQAERVMFRHDRVRTQLLCDEAIDLMQIGQLDDVVVSEPFFADVIGTALADPTVSPVLVERVGASNPLALFHALKVFREPSANVHHAVLCAIDSWLSAKDTQGRANRALRWAALQVLSETESSHVLGITDRFNDRAFPFLFARLRNGDVDAGIQLCLRIEPGVTAPWRDRQIAHAKVRFRTIFIHRLDELLKQPDPPDKTRVGVLRLAGYLAEPALADGIAACWVSDLNRMGHLADYLWAAAECCGDDPPRLLGPVCDAWAKLSDVAPKDGLPSPRNSVAAHEISWAFKETLPPLALRYFIEQAQRKELHWPITYMLRGIDQPDAVEFIAREFAAHSRISEGTDRFWHFPSLVIHDWHHQQAEKWRGMSLASRQRLQELWTSTDNDKHLRRQAFLLWAATSARDDVLFLQAVVDPDPIADDILWARLKRGDSTAIPMLLDKLRTDKHGYWWQLGRYIWSNDLTNALEEAFRLRGATVKRTWGAGCAIDWISSELVMRLKPSIAEKILIDHWEHLQYSSHFFQTALYVATPNLCALARDAISKCPDATEMLKHISMHFGIKCTGHPGVNRIEQVEALVPYLDYLSPLDIHAFWELCSDRGWLDFRRAHLDGRLEGQWRKNTLLDEATLFVEWDKEIARDHIGWMGFWINHYLSQGEQLENIFNLLKKWLNQRRAIPALEFVAAAVSHAGGRCDLDVLSVDGIEPVDQVQAIIADAYFTVRLRSLA